MRSEVRDLVGSGLLLGGLVLATVAAIAPAAPAAASGGGSAPEPVHDVARPTLVGGTASVAVAGGAGSASAGSATDLAGRGRMLFHTKGCAGCHSRLGEVGPPFSIAPDLSDLAARAGLRKPGMSAQAYVRESIRTPQAFIVPGFTSVNMPDLHLTDAEIDAVAAFLLSPPR